MNPKYNHIGISYNTTRRADPYLTDRLRALLHPASEKIYLDIGCGTGNYTIALSKKGLNFTGVEPSEKMLTEARASYPQINWLSGSAEQIPADDDTFDGAMATLTIHHWTDLNKGIKELYRVCKHQSRIVFFTATPAQMEGYWLNHYFPRMLEASIEQMPTLGQIKSTLENAGFEITGTEKYFVQQNLQDLFLYSGKHQPELYFDANVRRGISSFAALANAKEVNEGLLKLRADVDKGQFEQRKKTFDNDKGDYLFILATKPKA
jgi:ubiquinone/menaquinone biosynthesis C-methylase UbiE